MKIGVYAPRRSSFPLVGPPALEAIKRGHQVTLLQDSRGAQIGDQWRPHEANLAFPGVAGVMDAARYRGDWILGPLLTPRPDIKTASLEPWLDGLAKPYADAAEVSHRTMRHGLVSTDAVAGCAIGLTDQVVWFLPKTRVPGLLNRAMRYLTMLVTARALKRVCWSHKMTLVLKTRTKIRVPTALRDLPLVGEEDLYPAPAIRLIASSRLVVCHQSAAALEAAALGTPCVNIRVPVPHLRAYPQYTLMTMRTQSPMAWPGVVLSLSLRELVRHRSIFIGADASARRAYLDTWLGGKVWGASSWVLDRMERRSS